MKNFLKKIIVAILEWEAKLILKKYKPKVVAITGSVGKTSTKDAVFAVLCQFYHVRKSDKSFNSELGLPLTIIGARNGWNNPFIWLETILLGLEMIVFKFKYPEWLVLEAGIGKPNDMIRTAKWLKTDVVIITWFGERPVHVEFFKSIEHVIAEKSELIKTLKHEGTLILNHDDPKVFDLKAKSHKRTVSYGYHQDSTFIASLDEVKYESDKYAYPTGIIFRVDYDGTSMPVSLDGVFGKSYVYSALAALAVAHELDLSMVKSALALTNYDVQPGRLRLVEGMKQTFIIDDTYNSSPVACELALRTLKEVGTPGKKIAILGDMLELGKYTDEAHQKMGEIAQECADILVTVGKRAHGIMDGALLSGMHQEKVVHFENSVEAGKYVQKIMKEGDIILVKGSQGVRMERAVEKLMLFPEQKETLLARQEKEWQNKK